MMGYPRGERVLRKSHCRLKVAVQLQFFSWEKRASMAPLADWHTERSVCT